MSSNSTYIPDFHQESGTLNSTIITHSDAFANKALKCGHYFQVESYLSHVGRFETIRTISSMNQAC